MLRLAGVLSLVLAFALGGCGDDDDGGNGGGGGGGSETVSAENYANALCKSAQDWVSGLQKRATDLQGSLSPGTSPAEGKEVLAGFLEDAIADTEDWIRAVEDAGVPDVDGGEDYANEIEAAATEAKEVLEETAADIDELPTDDPRAFAREAGSVGDSARTALSEVGDAIAAPESSELRSAIQDASACQGLTGAS